MREGKAPQRRDLAARFIPLLGALTVPLLAEETTRVVHLKHRQTVPWSISQTHTASQGTSLALGPVDAALLASIYRQERPIDALKSRLEKLESRLLVEVIQDHPKAFQLLAVDPIKNSFSSSADFQVASPRSNERKKRTWARAAGHHTDKVR